MKQYRLIDIPRFDDPRGTLSVIEGKPLLPFTPVRLFYIYGVPESEKRGCHALKNSEEFIIALAGGFSITVDDGHSKTDFELSRPDYGLYIPPLTWHVLHNFAPRTVCGVLASKPYDQDGYYRAYEDFLDAVRSRPRT
jgi:WxcM-like, C-terminal